MYVYIDIYTFTHFKKYVQACEYSNKDIDFYLYTHIFVNVAL